jgi:lysophospholipase L1-like esterase
MTSRFRRRVVFPAALALFSFCLAYLCGEVALRIVFRDGGRTTLGGPGGRRFEYEFAHPTRRSRGPHVSGPKAPGTRRLLVLGDSITWGVGVSDWRQLYPARLLATLNAGGGRYDMDVISGPGRDIDAHARAARVEVPRLDPDFVIYQWYANDLEFGTPRPSFNRAWRGAAWHRWLRRQSYLYFFLDDRFSRLVPPGDRAYVDYLLGTFRNGTTGWARFLNRFHRWAVHSTTGGRRALVVLYPQVPFRGRNPLEDIHVRMRALADGAHLTFPAAMFHGESGENRADASAADGRVRRSMGRAGQIAVSPRLPLTAGAYVLSLRLRLDGPARGEVASVIVSDGPRPIAQRRIDAGEFTGPGRWSSFPVEFEVEPPLTESVSWALSAPTGARISADTFTLPVRYERLDVLDLAPRLNTFDTHASIFDAHPNVRAHAEVATVLADWVRAQDR